MSQEQPAYSDKLLETISLLSLKDHSIHAADESGGNISKKFEQLGVSNTPENRIAYRGAMITTPAYSETISGIILFDETFRQSYQGQAVVEILNKLKVVVGVKVDSGLVPFLNSNIEQVGKDELSLLAGRMKEYSEGGVRFTKFRVVANIGKESDGRDTPTVDCLKANSELLAGYAKICHDYGVVPIVEPEVTMEGDHSIEQCFQATQKFIIATFAALQDKECFLPGVILKTNMVLAGTKVAKANDSECVEKTLAVLRHVPEDVGAVVFLSGGQSTEDAMARLQAIRSAAAKESFKFPISSSFSRALQGPALEAFGAAVKANADASEITKQTQASFSQCLEMNKKALRNSFV